MISNGTGSLQTVDGTWTFGAPYSAAVGNWYILLNGELVGGAAGSQLKVDNGGQLYALGTDNNWYVWQEDSWVMFAAALPCDITPPNNALRACFFDGTNAPLTASSALQQRVQTNIPSPVGAWSGFFEDWGNESVAGTGKSDDVSGVWRGSVNFLAGTYVFHTQSDDGVELTIDGTKVIDNWTNHPLTTDDSAPLLLTAGLHTVQLRWYENSGEAAIGLSWDYAP
jgi:hypothetical protein